MATIIIPSESMNVAALKKAMETYDADNMVITICDGDSDDPRSPLSKLLNRPIVCSVLAALIASGSSVYLTGRFATSDVIDVTCRIESIPASQELSARNDSFSQSLDVIEGVE